MSHPSAPADRPDPALPQSGTADFVTRDAASLSAFAVHLGLTTIRVSARRVEAELLAAPGLLNRNQVLHGGALMALADILGGAGTFAALRPDQGTTTVESKTNFFRPVPPGEVVRAISVPLHAGRSTMVWQTSILRADGKIAAMVTQTQMILNRPPPSNSPEDSEG